jgi:hypothetical protein
MIGPLKIKGKTGNQLSEKASKSYDHKYNLNLLVYIDNKPHFKYTDRLRRVYVRDCPGCNKKFFTSNESTATCGDKCRSLAKAISIEGAVYDMHYKKDIPLYAVHLFLPNGKIYLIDSVDLDSCCRFKWTSDKDNYVITTFMDKKSNKRIYLKLHRLIMRAKPGETVDHVNGNPLDNRKENLRLVSKQVNALNVATSKKGKIHNVHIKNGNYIFRIAYLFNGKRKTYQKSFKTEREAIAFRDEYKSNLINKLTEGQGSDPKL